MSNKPFSYIGIIYNPKSTGNSFELASRLHKKLLKLEKIDCEIELVATKHQGHATELAEEIAKKHTHPLIISSSGDGGYNEIINGAMKAQTAGATPVCAVLPAGNANDHHRTLSQSSLFEAIKSHRITHIDLIKATYSEGKKTEVKYAHSYIGIGLTPEVAKELNQHDLTKIKELQLATKKFFSFEPINVVIGNKEILVDSLIASNIGEMAKVITLADNADVKDGKFELTIFPHQNRLKLLGTIAKATATSIRPTEKRSRFTFSVPKETDIQFDGEVVSLKNATEIDLVSSKQTLATLL